jgi:hypothetical protein
MRKARLLTGLVFAGSLAIPAGLSAQMAAGTVGSRLDPDDFSSLGALTMSGGTLTIDTSSGGPTITLADSPVPSENFIANGTTTQTATGSSIAVFTFSSITLSSGTVELTGNLPLALLSKTDATISVSMDASGADSADIGAAPGRVGGYPGGARGVASSAAVNGPGFGIYASTNAGGGAGHGGIGGRGGNNINFLGGRLVSTNALYEFLGGSGGAGGGSTNETATGGGAGGGAIQIGANDTLTLSPGTVINVDGGDALGILTNTGLSRPGGGGAGGAILLSGNAVNADGAILSARGGNGGDSFGDPLESVVNRGGGGGGGGRVAIFYNDSVLPPTYELSGGAGGQIPVADAPTLKEAGKPGEAGKAFALQLKANTRESIPDPDDFASLGSLVASAGTLVIDTDALTATLAGSGANDGVYQGVLTPVQSGEVALAAFCFSNIDLDKVGGLTIDVTGSNALALLSKGNARIAADITLDGGAGFQDAQLIASSRAGGARGLRGNEAGLRGPAGPRPGGVVDLHGGGGGGFGGNGGQGSPTTGGLGGSEEPGAFLPVLWGGSAGGGGGRGNTSASSAGSGGGALGVFAAGNLTITGATLSSVGGAGGDMFFDGIARTGGGGSGGAFLFLGNQITVTNSTISVEGGRGGDANDGTNGSVEPKRAGGGGGGGRIAFLYNSGFSESGANYVVAGGRGGYADGGGALVFGEDGFPGTVTSGEVNPAIIFPNTVGSRLDPQSVPSLGALTATGGTLAFNTNSDVRSVTFTNPGNPAQNFSLTGSRALSETGSTEMTAFCFDTVSLTGGVTIEVEGNRPLALLSKSNLTLGVNIDLSGGNGGNNALAAPAIAGGGLGGARGIATSSAVNGPGAGQASRDFLFGGGGGAFGGAGGKGGPVAGEGGLGGTAYGNQLLAELLGGSGGAGGRGNTSGSGAGAAGGAVQLAASGILTIQPGTVVRTNGGQGGDRADLSVLRTGGGGSGGGILLSAPEVVITGAILEAEGGKGGDATDLPDIPGLQTHPKRGGGGGGGGRIAIYTDVDFDLETATVSVAGGPGGIATHEGDDPDPEIPRERSPGDPGETGTIYLSTAPVGDVNDSWSVF